MEHVEDYTTSNFEQTFSKEDLREADREVQIDVMTTWFRARFEDPAEMTPYESKEGGYIWMWGGPYAARMELEDEFSEIVPGDVIAELVEDLEAECHEWAPRPKEADYDEYFIDEIAGTPAYYHNFVGAILDLEKLLEAPVDPSVSGCFHRLLHTNAITALETYLSDAFVNTVLSDPQLTRRFVESTPVFQQQKISVSQIYAQFEGIEHRVKAYLANLVWHNLTRVKPLFRATLGIEFPADCAALSQAIAVRHDIVHRNGKTKDGEEILPSSQDVRDLIKQVESFMLSINEQLSELRNESD